MFMAETARIFVWRNCESKGRSKFLHYEEKVEFNLNEILNAREIRQYGLMEINLWNKAFLVN